MGEVMLPVKKGRPLLIGNEVVKQVQAYIKDLRRCQATVNTAIVISAAEVIVKDRDANLLSCNGGTIELTRDWAKHLMKRMGFNTRLPRNHRYPSMILMKFEKHC